MSRKYVIKYEIHLENGSIIKDKEIKVDCCESNVGAQIKLEKYLIKKYTQFKQLVVHSCSEDVMSMFDDILGGKGFRNIFAGGSSFGKN